MSARTIPGSGIVGCHVRRGIFEKRLQCATPATDPMHGDLAVHLDAAAAGSGHRGDLDLVATCRELMSEHSDTMARPPTRAADSNLR